MCRGELTPTFPPVFCEMRVAEHRFAADSPSAPERRVHPVESRTSFYQCQASLVLNRSQLHVSPSDPLDAVVSMFTVGGFKVSEA